MSTAEDARAAGKLDAVLDAYRRDVAAGKPADRAALLEAHPDLASQLAAVFADQDAAALTTAPRTRPPAAHPHTSETPTAAPVAPAARPRAAFGGYEIIQEIARGGMGVVYKARQVSLGRLVALKTILDRAEGSAPHSERFRREAEAAAQLDHPHILPIYEVGEHEGRPYFAMKLVEGGSLAERIPEFRADPRRAVELLIKVARAVHFAHQRGILHRDLKPANILLDRDGIPYVGDFGLAKQVAEDSRLTASGAIVGTPSYMAPEQARAEKQLTTSADVYSLGAILYELLASRPPFRAATALDTILQVREQEPAPPRQVNPNIPRDLEAVVLKCLAKAPGRRYESAAAVADDLERWLRREPIEARQPSPAERLYLYFCRHPAQAILTFAVVCGMPALAATRADGGRLHWLAGGVFGTLFIAWMASMIYRHVRALERRLDFERPTSERPTDAGPAAPGLPDLVSRRELGWALAKGLLNGAVVGLALVVAELLLPWRPGHLKVVLPVALILFGALAGATAATVARLALPPFGRLPWVRSFLVGAVVLALGSWDWRLLHLATQSRHLWILIAVPLAEVGWDLWTRYCCRVVRQRERSGKVPRVQVRLAEGQITDNAVRWLPAMLMVGGVIAGDWPGRVLGRAWAAEHYQSFGAEFGSLLGRLTGLLLGAVAAVVVLRLYRVERDRAWPGRAHRPYPAGIAVIEFAVTVLAVGLLLHVAASS
jgi:serine/threonine-protein kinase